MATEQRGGSYRLTMFDVTMLVISLVIGMGIFRAPATVAARAGNETLFYLAWIVGGVVALSGGLTFAGIGRRMPVSGAYYRIFAAGYHPVIAFAVNIIILVSNAASAAGVAIIGAEYVAPYTAGLPTSIVATSMIVVLYGLNLLGLRTSARVQNVLIGIKVAMLLCIVAALVVLDPATSPTLMSVSAASGNAWGAFGLALLAVSFTYGGYQSTINFGGEIRDSERTMPRAIIVGMLIVTAIYLLANMAYVHVLGFDQLAASSSIAALVAERLFGPVGSQILTGVLVISVFGYVNVAMLSNPRVIHAMSLDGVLPSALALTSSDGRMRQGALLAFTLLSVCSVYVGKTFETLLNYTIFIDAIGLACGAATLYWLKGPRLTSLQHICAAIFLASCVYTAINILLFDTQAAIFGTLLFAGIIGVGALLRRSNPA